MFEQNNICPYTGLRSFNEEESLYFEGREQQITEITEMLEKNRFLMVTGASGDGKSSIVYAGIIPNARAGFFKAKYPNWVIADFRPEKSPLKNFSRSIARALDFSNSDTVETEINRGFSSLVELYKTSKYYHDEESVGWLNASEEERLQAKNRGANLMIIVDQFEEFFTTNDNYFNGVPSQESQTTVNVILETTKIALEEDIPVYVICTMRSDYIGQCASFRGLPEYIGFSQFFVPRLKRNQLQKVIEEPAILSGNSISRRLVERLIYDLNEGNDQLPILQHALNQIWKVANVHGEEMDLVHYAMVGGMPANELPGNDQEKFLTWYKDLPEYQRKSYKTPSLENVLDIHANMLYEGAAAEYNKKYPDHPIDIGEAKRAIALTFACLSKMDEGRGVRNRMTLQEITDIINNPNLDTTRVGRLLNIFREEGNTFIRPFILSNEDATDLTADSVLDITHESLIRNWQRLKNWAWKEAEYHDTFVDFKKQLDRWINNKKSRNYLLPVGPLGYFEGWFGECNPNAFWINRYQETIEDPDVRLNSSREILDQSETFLKKSAQKHLLAKLFMKYGARNIAITMAILSTLVLSSFYYQDAIKKQNVQVLDNIYNIAEEHINNEENLGGFKRAKAQFLFSGLIHDPGKSFGIITNITSPELKVEVPIETYKNLIYQLPDFEGWEKDTLLKIIRSNINSLLAEEDLSPKFKLGNVNSLISSLAHDLLYVHNESVNTTIQEQAEIAYQMVSTILSSSPSDEIGIGSDIYLALQHINNFSEYPVDRITEIITLISPFEETGKKNFDRYFPLIVRMANGADASSHNGGYQLMAELYASLGNKEFMYKALDELKAHNNVLNYAGIESYNNFYQIFGYLIRNNHLDLLSDFVKYVNDNFDVDPLRFFINFIDRSGYSKYFNLTNIYSEHEAHPGRLNPVLSHLAPEIMSRFFDFASSIVDADYNKLTASYYQALFLKARALITNKYLTDKKLSVPVESIDEMLEEAFDLFQQVDPAFLNSDIEVYYRYYSDGIRRKMMSHNDLFLYPDLFTGGYHGSKYLNGFFVDFLKRHPEYLSSYDEPEEMELFIDWIGNAHEFWPFFDDVERFEEKLTLDQLTFVHDLLSKSPHASGVDRNLLNLLICNNYLASGDSTTAMVYYNDLNLANINISGARGEYLNVTFFYNEIVRLASNFAMSGNKELTHNLIGLINEVHFRMKSYFIIARRVHDSDFPEDTYHYLDAGYKALDQFDPGSLPNTPTYGFTIIETLSGIGSHELDALADREVRKFYPGGTQEAVSGKIKTSKYYQAFEAIPASNTIPEDLGYYRYFLLNDSKNLDDMKWGRVKELLKRYGPVENDYISFAIR